MSEYLPPFVSIKASYRIPLHLAQFLSSDSAPSVIGKNVMSDELARYDFTENHFLSLFFLFSYFFDRNAGVSLDGHCRRSWKVYYLAREATGQVIIALSCALYILRCSWATKTALLRMTKLRFACCNQDLYYNAAIAQAFRLGKWIFAVSRVVVVIPPVAQRGGKNASSLHGYCSRPIVPVIFLFVLLVEDSYNFQAAARSCTACLRAV